MSTLTLAAHDSATMLRRDLRRSVRVPMMTASGILTPVVFLLLFAGVFGRALSAALGTAHYVDYLAPGILVMTAGFAAEGTAVSVCSDMAAGIISRLKTMPVSPGSVLAGQAAGSVLRSVLSAVLVTGAALALGFRPAAGVTAWIAAAGVFTMLAVALTWLAVAFGLLAKTPAGANSLALLPAILPFVSSAFIPARYMPAGVAWFAAHQPFTPVIDTLRGLLTGTAVGSSAALAAAWCAGIALAGYLWARWLYQRGPAAGPAA